MRERMSWDELVKAYPDSWVVLDNVVFTDSSYCNLIESGDFIETVSLKEAALKWRELQNSNNKLVIAYTGDKHVHALMSPCSRMQWDELEKNYPDMWVVLKDAEHEDNDPKNPNIESGIVMCSATDEQIDAFWLFSDEPDLKYYVIRTSDNFPVVFSGVTL